MFSSNYSCGINVIGSTRDAVREVWNYELRVGDNRLSVPEETNVLAVVEFDGKPLLRVLREKNCRQLVRLFVVTEWSVLVPAHCHTYYGSTATAHVFEGWPE
jgi:hypothetical protein